MRLPDRVRARAAGVLWAVERRLPLRTFDRPVFIIAMPRSGSTLLFDLLRVHEGVRNWGDEAYPPWAAVDPAVGTGPLGDAFRSSAVDAGARRRAEWRMHRGVVGEERRLGRAVGFLDSRGARPYRLVEKTPANVLRVLDLDRMFPDARFVFLTRDAPANVASILEAWELGLAPRQWPRNNRQTWEMLMPPGWQAYVGRSPVECSAFQWRAGNQAAVADLTRIDGTRVHLVRYEDLVADATRVMSDVCSFADLAASPAVTVAAEELRPTKVVLSSHRPGKWRDRWPELAPHVIPLASLRRTLGYNPDDDPPVF